MVIKYLEFLKRNKGRIINILILIIIILFLFSFFKPEFIFLKTTTSGGDTASHYYTAYYMKNYLLPHGKISGWTPGNYAGFPILNFYFPFPFVLMALLGYIIPLEIAFKLITILGILLLPITTFFFFKLMNFKFPIPIIAAMSSLFFLFIETHSMWGGNIPSTLAGEFTYSIGLALSILFFGTLYAGVKEKKYLILNSVLLVLIGISHVYTLLFAGFSSFFFLLTKKYFKENLKYLLKIYALSFLLLSFWFFPLISKLKYTTPFALKWHIQDIWALFPKIIIPFAILTIISLLLLINKKIRKDDRIYFLFFIIIVSIFFYFIAPKLEVISIRFIPFIHLFLIFTGIFALDKLIKKLKLKWVIPLIFIIITISWVNYNETYIGDWVKWNYEGFENKRTWPTYNGVNQFLEGDFNDPRVVYEHAQHHNIFGTPRAFESLPLFANRATLEGVYMQSSPSAPAIFYIQSEISKEQSCPFPTFSCTKTDIDSAINHLKMFNVNQIIAVSDRVKKELRNKTKLVFKEKEYEVFEIESTGYVSVPKYWPVLIKNKNPDLLAYYWFINDYEVPIVFTDKTREKDKKYLDIASGIDNLSKNKINKKCNVQSELKEEEINFQTDCIGLPHIIKVSYFPNWKVIGAKEIYYVSPSFMLVFPEKNNVKLYYGRTFMDVIGLFLTLAGIIFIILIYKNKTKLKFLDKLIDFILKRKLFLVLIIIILFGLFFLKFNEKDVNRDELDMKIALSTKKYTQCQNAGALKDECYIEIAKLTKDWNLCVVKVSEDSKDICFKEIGILLKDENICKTRIKGIRLRKECLNNIK